MVKVRLVRGRHNSRDAKGVHVVYEKGEEFSVTDTQYKAFKDKFERLDGKDDEAENSKFDVKKASVDELLAKAEELKLDVSAIEDEKDLRKAVAKALKK